MFDRQMFAQMKSTGSIRQIGRRPTLNGNVTAWPKVPWQNVSDPGLEEPRTRAERL